MKTYILYHGNCDDGFGGAWAAWKALGDEAEYIPVLYGDNLPPMYGDCNVVIVDFSYPRDILRGLKAAVSGELTVLDHHKTSQEDLEGLDFCIFDMNKSGAILGWEYWHPHDPAPKLIEYVQDRDLWRKELPDSEAITAWLRSYPRYFERWSDLAERLDSPDLDLYVMEGKAILRSQEKYIGERLSQAVEVEIGREGHVVLALNETQHFSEIAGILAEVEDYPFGATFFIRPDGKKQWSLRSRGDFDVSAVAKSMGGGGHKNASGFVE